MSKSKKLIAYAMAGLMAASMAPQVMADDEDFCASFTEDFESYETAREYVRVYGNPTGTSVVNYARYNTGMASSTYYALKEGATSPLKANSIATPLPGDLYERPIGYIGAANGNYVYAYIDMSKFEYGGLPGYYGWTSNNEYPIEFGNRFSREEETFDMCVVDDEGDNVLQLSPPGQDGNYATTGLFSWFGKSGIRLANRTNLIKYDVKIVNDEQADGFRMTVLKNDQLGSIKSWQNYEWMTGNVQFTREVGGGMYDAVMFRDGKIYLGPDFGTHTNLNKDAYVCDYQTGVNYTVEYYLNLNDLKNPSHMVYIYDESGVLVGKKSLPINLRGDATTTTKDADGTAYATYKDASLIPDEYKGTMTTINNPYFYPDLIKRDAGMYIGKYNNAFQNVPCTFTAMDSFIADDTYGIAFSNTTKMGMPKYTRTSQITYVDDISLNEEKLAPLAITTDPDAYTADPIAFVGEQKVDVEFNYDLISDVEDCVSVVDDNGEAVEHSTKLVDGDTVEITFADGTLGAASNYYVSFDADTNSVAGTLGAEKRIRVRTSDNLKFESVSHSGTTLNATVKNQSSEDWSIVTAAIVKKNGKPVMNTIFYKAATLTAGDKKTFTFENISCGADEEIEVFCLDGLNTIRAYIDSVSVD